MVSTTKIIKMQLLKVCNKRTNVTVVRLHDGDLHEGP